MSSLTHSFIAATLILTASACSSSKVGNVHDRNILTSEISGAEIAASPYTIPQYTIGISRFENKIPAKVSDANEAVESILEMKLEGAGLNSEVLDENLSSNNGVTAALPQTGIIKNTFHEYTSDFRLSGAITAYSEVEEGIDTIVFQQKTSVSRITIDYTLVDISSGKTILSESGTGEYRKIITSSSKSSAKATFDPALRDGALNDALGKAANKIVQKLSALPFQGRILSIDHQSVVFKAGTRSGLEEEAELDVFHAGEAILDLQSGKIIGFLESKVGQIQITRHRNENISEASIVSGSAIQAGDIVRQLP